jgi:hypothetical protein
VRGYARHGSAKNKSDPQRNCTAVACRLLWIVCAGPPSDPKRRTATGACVILVVAILSRAALLGVSQVVRAACGRRN